MNITAKAISDMIKIRCAEDIDRAAEKKSVSALLGEHFAYQTAVTADEPDLFKISVHSEIEKYITVYLVKDVLMDFPAYPFDDDGDYLTTAPGKMPDLLVPAARQNGCVRAQPGYFVLWIDVNLPRDAKAGSFDIEILICGEKASAKSVVTLNIKDAVLPEQKLIFTQWLHVDCIASAHGVPVYGSEHWELIEKYIKMAAHLGINMILTPVITPPLDTEIGSRRPCTQLVKFTEKDGIYSFDFTLLKRWIELCLKNGIKYFEISHLFSQWGLEYSPNIVVNGEYMFGWHVKAADPAYGGFLKQFIPALRELLRSEGVEERCFFHISDEPRVEHLEAYRFAYDLLTPLLKGCRIMDAISDFDFYETGLIKTPVTATNYIEPFLEHDIKNLWAYYCCGQGNRVGNRFLAMPHYRGRILGLQLYKYGMEGFLQWGYNFYYSSQSLYEINPYITTSADRSFPSGDAFTVYPGKNEPLPSARGFVFLDALQDIALCRKLEEKIGKDAVVRLIEEEAKMEITFSEYPRNDEFIPRLADKIREML